jgi:hypothetical protein
MAPHALKGMFSEFTSAAALARPAEAAVPCAHQTPAMPAWPLLQGNDGVGGVMSLVSFRLGALGLLRKKI